MAFMQSIFTTLADSCKSLIDRTISTKLPKPYKRERERERERERLLQTTSGFGALEVACCLLVPKFAGSHPAEAVGFLRRKNSSARLPSEGK